METVTDFIFLGSKISADGDCSHEVKGRLIAPWKESYDKFRQCIKKHLLLWRKAMTNLDSILKSRNITLLTMVHLVKALVFPVAMY